MPVQPDLKWYTNQSRQRGLPPRCPFASVHRCPRYFASLSLLGECGIATKIDPSEDARLLKRWKQSDFWPIVPEEATRISGSEDPSTYAKFCPEVAF